MAIQIASPFNSFDIMSKPLTKGSLFGINPASGRSCSYVYAKGTGYFQILRNLMKAIPNQQMYPMTSMTIENGDYVRPLPMNLESATYSSSSRLNAHIDMSLMYDTSSLNLCTVINLGTGNFNNPIVIPSQLGVRYNNFDFYCEMVCWPGGQCLETRDRKIRAFLLISQNLPAYSGDINIRIEESSAIELNVQDLGDFKYSLSGYIKANATFYDNTNWVSSNGRLSLVVLNENNANFGATGMGTMDFYFPENNSYTWEKIWQNGYIQPEDDSLYNYILEHDYSGLLNNAMNQFVTIGSDFSFFLMPIGYAVSVPTFVTILGIALLFIVLEKLVL